MTKLNGPLGALVYMYKVYKKNDDGNPPARINISLNMGSA